MPPTPLFDRFRDLFSGGIATTRWQMGQISDGVSLPVEGEDDDEELEEDEDEEDDDEDDRLSLAGVFVAHFFRWRVLLLLLLLSGG